MTKDNSDKSAELQPKVKTSGYAIIAFILGLLSIFLIFFTSIPAVVLGLVSLSKIKKSDGRLKGRKLAKAAITIAVVVPLLFILWSIDAPPIPNDYTLADINSADLKYNYTYDLLLSLDSEDANNIGITDKESEILGNLCKLINSQEDFAKIFQIIDANEIVIEQIWQKTKKARDIIEQLAQSPQIADLTEPQMDADIGFLQNARDLSRAYCSYAILKMQQNNSMEAVTELARIDSVIRKLNVHARSLVTKLACMALIKCHITIADCIINDPRTTPQAIELLTQHFMPLTKEQTSFKTSFICEYIMSRNALDNLFSSAHNPVVIKRNSTLRLFRNNLDSRINHTDKSKPYDKELFSIWPKIYSFMPQVKTGKIDKSEFPLIYKCYNFVGFLLFEMLTPAQDSCEKHMLSCQIHDDLFQIILNTRLSKDINLKARAYGDEYIIDRANGKIFSPGPDKKADTKDDIKLLINPKILTK